MLLKIRRQQRTGGIVTDKVFFQLDARVELTAQETSDVRKYKLGSKVIYNSEASKKQLAHAAANRAMDTFGGHVKAIGQVALALMKLNITINDLVHGKHIECKDMDELLGAENAVLEACQGLKVYLDTAATFDGREILVDFSSGEPQIVGSGSAPLAQIAPPTPSPTPPPAAIAAPVHVPPPEAVPTLVPVQATYEAPPPVPEPIYSPPPVYESAAPAYAASAAAIAPAEFMTAVPGEPPLERLQRIWSGLETPQRVAVVVGGVVAGLLLIQIF